MCQLWTLTINDSWKQLWEILDKEKILGAYGYLLKSKKCNPGFRSKFYKNNFDDLTLLVPLLVIPSIYKPITHILVPKKTLQLTRLMDVCYENTECGTILNQLREIILKLF